MQPISFPQQNHVLGKPEDMTDDECSPLPTHHYNQPIEGKLYPAIISCWKLSPEELEEVQRTGVVWVSILGKTLAPFIVFTQNPFASEEPTL